LDALSASPHNGNYNCRQVGILIVAHQMIYVTIKDWLQVVRLANGLYVL
jgi:hypothetical protein